MKSKHKLANLVAALLLVVLGVVMLIHGIREIGIETDPTLRGRRVEDYLDHMIFTIPGILLILDAGLFLLREHFDKTSTFLALNSIAFFLLCFCVETVYMLVERPSVHKLTGKLLIPGLLISFVVTIAVFVFGVIHANTRSILLAHFGPTKKTAEAEAEAEA